MALTPIVWFDIFQSIILTLGSFVFVGIMVKNYFKKRTMGTALLTIVYILVAIRHANGVVFNFYSKFNPLSTGHKLSLIIYLTVFILMYYFLYLFGSRHLIRDNDVIRGIMSAIILVTTMTIIGMIGYEFYADVENPIFVEYSIEPGTNSLQPMPTTIVGAVLYGVILVFVQFRYIFSLSVSLIRQKSIDPIKRIGTKYILAAMITFFLDVSLTVAFTIDSLTPVVVAILYVTRFFLTMASLAFGYIGWILPDWFRKRVRRKTWIATKLAQSEISSTATFVTASSFRSETNLE